MYFLHKGKENKFHYLRPPPPSLTLPPPPTAHNIVGEINYEGQMRSGDTVKEVPLYGHMSGP